MKYLQMEKELEKEKIPGKASLSLAFLVQSTCTHSCLPDN